MEAEAHFIKSTSGAPWRLNGYHVYHMRPEQVDPDSTPDPARPVLHVISHFLPLSTALSKAKKIRKK